MLRYISPTGREWGFIFNRFGYHLIPMPKKGT